MRLTLRRRIGIMHVYLEKIMTERACRRLEKKAKKTFMSLLYGAAAGFVNGLLGAGGGMLVVPALTMSGLNRKKAHANSVAVIMPLSLLSASMYLLSGSVKLTDAAPYIPSCLLGAAAGSLLLGKFPDKWLKRIFAGFMIWAGIRIFL